jgi:6-phosphogluconate dehydrogenase
MMGLGVMGHMLVHNMECNGFRVAGYYLDTEEVRFFGTKYPKMNNAHQPFRLESIVRFLLDPILI